MFYFLFFLATLLFVGLIGVYAERKIAAFIQDRIGPNRVGKYGIFQTIADVMKLAQKEDIIPTNARKYLFMFAPILVFTSVLSCFAVFPLSRHFLNVKAPLGVLYIIAILSFDVMGILMAGIGSHNKYSLLGSIRAVSQIIAYSIPNSLALLCVIIFTNSFDFHTIAMQQSIFANERVTLFGIISSVEVNTLGGFFLWNIVKIPILIPVLILYFISALAECNRTPFDVAEAESELVGGYHTEYSGLRWGFFMLAEYGKMFLVSLIIVFLFFGGWTSPFPNVSFLNLGLWTSGIDNTFLELFWGVFWIITKSSVGVFLQIWIRWSFPRLRIDQIFILSWKYLVPLTLLIFLLCILWKVIFINPSYALSTI